MFLENLMIREQGLFVLMGSKPITLFCMGPEGNGDAEWIADTKRIWPEYQKTMREYMGPVFSIIKARIYKTGEYGYFINALNTAAILKTYYRDFVQVVGKEFDPFVMVKELCEDKESPFWDTVFSNHYLNGLLLGYGPHNSAGFLWAHENNITFPIYFIMEENMGGEFPEAYCKEHVSIKDLTIPTLRNYGIGDEVLEKYKREKVAILKEFKGKDFTETVKKWLSRGSTK